MGDFQRGNLIKCPMCEKEISPNAESCPNCGEPMKKSIINIGSNQYSVILKKYGKNHMKVLTVLREIKKCDLRTAMDIMKSVPVIVLEDCKLEEAEEFKERFINIGAEVSIIDGNNKVIELNENNQIRCPNCKVTNVKKISGMSKVSSVAVFGIFSLGKLNKTYECKSCGYRW